METSFDTQNKQRIVDDDEEEGKETESAISSSSSSSSEEEVDDESIGRVSSSDNEEPAEGEKTSSETCLLSSSSKDHLQNDRSREQSPFEMSSLKSALLKKRGLSMYYDGKSESFRSLSSVTCVGDLAKPQRPYKRSVKSSSSPSGRLQDIRELPSPEKSPETNN